jgi:hypothetical protein
MTDRKDEVAPFAIERPEGGTALEAGRSVVLSRRDAGELVECVGAGAKVGWVFRRRRAVEGLYRIVPGDELREGLASGGFRYAVPSSGDASVQVLDSRGKFAGRAELRSAAGPSAMKLIGPAAWQAMAMATQQHYLVEISGKLAAIDGKLDELIARDEDLKLSGSLKARALAAAVQATLSAGDLVTPQRRDELGALLRRVDDDWRELWVRTDRLLKSYQLAESDQEAAARVDVSWSQLLRATQAPWRCGARKASGSPDAWRISMSWPSDSTPLTHPGRRRGPCTTSTTPTTRSSACGARSRGRSCRPAQVRWTPGSRRSPASWPSRRRRRARCSSTSAKTGPRWWRPSSDAAARQPLRPVVDRFAPWKR